MNTLNFSEDEFKCKCGCGLSAQDALILAMQSVRDAWGKPMTVNCGARCQMHNYMVGGAKNSAHLYGLAADIADEDGSLKAWIEPQLERFGLWLENPISTVGWAHLQIRPASTRVFNP